MGRKKKSNHILHDNANINTDNFEIKTKQKDGRVSTTTKLFKKSKRKMKKHVESNGAKKEQKAMRKDKSTNRYYYSLYNKSLRDKNVIPAHKLVVLAYPIVLFSDITNVSNDNADVDLISNIVINKKTMSSEVPNCCDHFFNTHSCISYFECSKKFIYVGLKNSAEPFNIFEIKEGENYIIMLDFNLKIVRKLKFGYGEVMHIKIEHDDIYVLFLTGKIIKMKESSIEDMMVLHNSSILHFIDSNTLNKNKSIIKSNTTFLDNDTGTVSSFCPEDNVLFDATIINSRSKVNDHGRTINYMEQPESISYDSEQQECEIDQTTEESNYNGNEEKLTILKELEIEKHKNNKLKTRITDRFYLEDTSLIKNNTENVIEIMVSTYPKPISFDVYEGNLVYTDGARIYLNGAILQCSMTVIQVIFFEKHIFFLDVQGKVHKVDMNLQNKEEVISNYTITKIGIEGNAFVAFGEDNNLYVLNLDKYEELDTKFFGFFYCKSDGKIMYYKRFKGKKREKLFCQIFDSEDELKITSDKSDSNSTVYIPRVYDFGKWVLLGTETGMMAKLYYC